LICESLNILNEFLCGESTFHFPEMRSDIVFLNRSPWGPLPGAIPWSRRPGSETVPGIGLKGHSQRHSGPDCTKSGSWKLAQYCYYRLNGAVITIASESDYDKFF